MPHGTRDWGVRNPISTVYTLEDMGELAVRLGSIVSHDRRGNVIFLEDFEYNANRWALVNNGAGAAIAINTDTYRSPDQCLRFTLGDADGNLSYAEALLPLPRDTGLGLEASWALNSAAEYVSCHFDWFDGTNWKRAGIRYDIEDEELQVCTDLNVWTAFATGIDLREDSEMFHTMKVVVDLINNAYIRAIVNHVEYSLSAYTPYVTASATSPQLRPILEAANAAAGNRNVWVDDVIITRNEE